MAEGTLARIVVFASGAGSGFGRLLDDQKSGRLPVQIVALACNVAGAGAIKVADAHGIPVALVEHGGLSREEHESQLLAAIQKTCGVDLEKDGSSWVVLAGYMRLFSPGFVKRLSGGPGGCSRAVNIHPSLLPAFPGMDAYAQAYNYGVKVTGCTVHLLSEGLDDGPIVAQAPLPLHDGETLESLKRRGHALEHEVYGPAVARLAHGGWKLEKVGDGPRKKVVFT